MNILPLVLCILFSYPAFAIMPDKQSQKDIQRFGLKQLASPIHRHASARAMAAFSKYNSSGKGQWKIRFDARSGGVAAFIGGPSNPHPGSVPDAALSFLTELSDVFGINPSSLMLETQNNSGRGLSHALFRQTYQGLPVEFARVKVDVGGSGVILGVHSSYEPNLSLNVTPGISQTQAAAVAAQDAGVSPQGQGTLVVFPNEQTGGDNLAWKFTVRQSGALWRYYVDAHSGQLLFRFNDLRMQTAGTVTGAVYDIDPNSTPAAMRPFANDRIYAASAANAAVTDAKGNYSIPVTGAIFAQLQGPYISVANDQGLSAHFDSGNSSWTTVTTLLSSPHPYAAGAVIVSTINISALVPNAVEFLPIFSQFQVGNVGGISGGDELFNLTQDDQVTLFDAFGNPIADYAGNLTAPFKTVAVPGQSVVIQLKASAGSSGGYGYDIAVSSVLVLNSPTTPGASNNVIWSSATTLNGHDSEINLFYHLNKMHDYFMADVDQGGAANLTPGSAMALVGPNLVNAYYDPDFNDLSFGDVSDAQISDAFADDATVPHHEYTHYMVQKIWNIQNFGQAGAISEANADYWSASSLNDPAIGQYLVGQVTGNSVPLRQIDDTQPCDGLNSPSCSDCPFASGPTCAVLISGANNNWTGEIHTDSVFLSQALWDIRRQVGQACSDELVFNSLLFFPESFQEFYDALSLTAQKATLAGCASAGQSVAQMTTAINSAFSAHGLLSLPGGEGFQSAVNVSTTPLVTGTIANAGQVNFYAFSAGPGAINLNLTLPASSDVPGDFSAYGITVFDRNHNIVAQALPPLNSVGTGGALGVDVCTSQDCTTTQQKFSLSYSNPGANEFFVEIAGAITSDGSNSGVNNPAPYTLTLAYNPVGAVASGIVTAQFDNDVISFSVNVTQFVQTQNYTFAYAQLRDQSLNVMPLTQTNGSSPLLTAVSNSSGQGSISGQLQLVPGFAARFPAVGTVYVEIFGQDPLGNSVSLGLSQAINLTANPSQTGMQAWNNVFNPMQGQKATVKYNLNSAGHVTLKIYTLSGVLVDTLFDSDVPAGEGSVDWGGQNFRGSFVASGVYLVHIDGPGISNTQKIVVVK